MASLAEVSQEMARFTLDRGLVNSANYGLAEQQSRQNGKPLYEVLVHAAEVSFKTISVIPVALFFIFGLVWLYERKKG